ncbi:MFS transporter [Nocardioides marmoribigeumensis]|uniref:MFS family permease n=1 Tax=Nocardioides marmoribigeumensis TaxID=433649 RepID=A0ABU2BW65_9ACTN|nr:MFS transporter [Nocardioides marmoribigeumensis]MDR7362881.1 MFS family permease [Nocardioides marmoribigeumensis]
MTAAPPLDAAERPWEPSTPVRAGWVSLLAVANLAVFAAFFGPLQVLLAQQAEDLSPGSKEATLGLVTGIGAFVAMVANPVLGACSDRTRGRFGRRRPWVLTGALVSVGGLALLSGSQLVALMVLGWALVQLGANGSLAAIMAAIPDRVPRTQRGVVGGTVALAQTVGALLGVGIASVTGDWAIGYLAVAVFVVLASLPYVLGGRDEPVRHVPAFSWSGFLRGFWVSPRRHPDFAWAWVVRFLVQLGNALGLVYLYYFLQDGVGYADPEGGVFLLTVVYAVSSVLTTVTSGRLSDRLGRRKVFIVVSGVVMALAATALALAPVWPMVVAGAVVLGAGFGVFTAVDYAVMTEVLPTAEDSGRDLGVINVAASLPQVFSPVLAGALVSSGAGYPGLYLLAALATLAGALAVGRIRGVR